MPSFSTLAHTSLSLELVMTPSRIASLTLAVGLAVALPTVVHAQPASRSREGRGTPASPADSMVVTTDWLASHLTDPKVVLIEVVMEPGKRGDRIPGSRELGYRLFTVRRDSLSTELPSADSLKTLLESIGVSSDARVVAYGSEAPMATRLLMTLDYLGHAKFSYLDGGMPKWVAEHRAVTLTDAPVARGSMTVRPRNDLVVTADWVTARLGKPGIALIDTRTLGEYNGTGNRSGMPSAGHLAGARQLEWETLFRADNALQLKDRAELLAMYNERATTGDTFVTYCWVGYRASATYFVARALGLNAKFYDGSYQDWQRRALPTKAGETP
jgi:thiosulfate/3-mercaptopyruvate sulfurtransferase